MNTLYFYLFLALFVFDNEPQIVPVAKALDIESGNPTPVDAIDVVIAVVAIDDNAISVISAILI